MTPSILDRIFAARRLAVAKAEQVCSLSEMRARAMAAEPARDFAAAISSYPFGLISEIKKGSPSRGVFDDNLDPLAIAAAYHAGGTSAISVVTEPEFFYGSLEWLNQIRRTVPQPLLRKDFIFSPYQMWEARAAGADAVLLILAMLEDHTAAELMATAAEAGLKCLVEVHDETEARRASALDVELVGVNNRDLNTFTVSLETSEQLIEHLPAAAIKVSESGIFTRSDCTRLSEVGYDAFLIGEALVTAANPTAKLCELRASDAPS